MSGPNPGKDLQQKPPKGVHGENPEWENPAGRTGSPLESMSSTAQESAARFGSQNSLENSGNACNALVENRFPKEMEMPKVAVEGTQNRLLIALKMGAENSDVLKKAPRAEKWGPEPIPTGPKSQNEDCNWGESEGKLAQLLTNRSCATSAGGGSDPRAGPLGKGIFPVPAAEGSALGTGPDFVAGAGGGRCTLNSLGQTPPG